MPTGAPARGPVLQQVPGEPVRALVERGVAQPTRLVNAGVLGAPRRRLPLEDLVNAQSIGRARASPRSSRPVVADLGGRQHRERVQLPVGLGEHGVQEHPEAIGQPPHRPAVEGTHVVLDRDRPGIVRHDKGERCPVHDVGRTRLVEAPHPLDPDRVVGARGHRPAALARGPRRSVSGPRRDSSRRSRSAVSSHHSRKGRSGSYVTTQGTSGSTWRCKAGPRSPSAIVRTASEKSERVLDPREQQREHRDQEFGTRHLVPDRHGQAIRVGTVAGAAVVTDCRSLTEGAECRWG